MYAVIGILIVLAVAYFLTSLPAPTPKTTETFSDITIPATIGPPPPVVEQAVVGANKPGQLASAPYQQIARNSPLPYQNPALTTTTRQRILTVLELLKDFLAFSANEIEYRSDPKIQLPLTTLRGDFQRLSDEANVIQRNPGLDPDLTEQDLDEIQANYDYLQREVDLIGSNRPFENKSVQNLSEGFQDLGYGADSGNNSTSEHATVDELILFSSKIQGEIVRLSASGTTDPTTNARITNLTKMKNDVDDVISKVNSGAMLATEVPIFKADIDNALPILGNMNAPLPQILKDLSLPTGLANALPTSSKSNPEEKRESNSILKKYLNTFFEGASASVNVKIKYISPNEVKIKESREKSKESEIDKTGFPSASDLDAVSGYTDGWDYDQGRITRQRPKESAKDDKITDPYAQDPRAESRSPDHFNWKGRARHIEDQIRKRGYKNDTFGLMPPNAVTSGDFSWKGYTKMICTRLGATMDTGLPVACGCPPADWKGW